MSDRHQELGPIELIRFVLPYLWPRGAIGLQVRVVAALGCIIVAKAVTISTPFFLKGAVDALSINRPSAIPLMLILAYGGARLSSSFFSEARDAVFARVSQRVGRHVARSIYAHVFELALRFHLERKTGQLAKVVERGALALPSLIEALLFILAPTLIEFAVVIAILGHRYPPGFALIIAGTILVYAAYTILTTNWRTKFRRTMNAAQNDFSAESVDGLINYEVVKAFGNEAYEVARLDRSLARYEEAAVRSDQSLGLLNFGQAAIIAVGITVVMIVAARGVVAGTLTVGDVVLVNTFILQLYQPLNFLGVLYREVKQALTDLENIVLLRREPTEIADNPGAPALAVTGGTVRFRAVHFAYDRRRPILAGVDLTVPAGRKVAVVGTSGAGKSTLVRLLFRFYDVTGGEVTVDGQDVREVSQASLRQAIGVVPQDTVLFNDTIAANIAYGRPGARQAEIEAAARTAQIHGFIEALPEGYATKVGERGLKLSGGEKQRVAIARVLLKDPPVLVLDEATSALDTRTEQALRAALDRVSQGRTTLVIAHRLSTVIDADEIVVLEAGRVAERGSHTALIARRGLYHAMWLRQQDEPLRAGAELAAR